MDVVAKFSHEKLDHAQDSTPQLVVSLKAPVIDWVSKRPSLCILPLVDLSGSMQGEKLMAVKASLLKLIDQLAPGDIAGLMAFESNAHVIQRPELVTPEFKTKLKNKIQALVATGGTNLGAGMLDAIELIEGLDLAPSFLKRVIVFTDGQPTSGIVDHSKLRKLLVDRKGSTTFSAFGFGNDTNQQWLGCDHKFLTDFSRDGQGNYAYVKDVDDSLTAFGRELGGLISSYAQDIKVELVSSNAHSITAPVTDVEIDRDELGEVSFKVSDILSEETRNFVFDTKLVKQAKVFPRPLNLFKVRVTYSILTSDGKRETKTVETQAKAQFVASGEEQKSVSKDLDEVISLAQLVRGQLEAEKKAREGDFKAAAAVLDLVGQRFERQGNIQSSRMARRLGARITQDSFAANEGYLRSFAAAGTRAYGVGSMDAGAAQDLATYNSTVSFGNASMNATTRSFTEDAGTGIFQTAETAGPNPAFLVIPELRDLQANKSE